MVVTVVVMVVTVMVVVVMMVMVVMVSKGRDDLYGVMGSEGL